MHPGDPSFPYGWFIKRNPRTFAGIDHRGRTVLITVDGRGAEDLGLSVPEAADVARSLGLVDAINLDGGGSTTMVVDGRVISHPSDATGERPVGDAPGHQPPASVRARHPSSTGLPAPRSPPAWWVGVRKASSPRSPRPASATHQL